MGDSVVERVRHAASGPSLSEEKNRVSLHKWPITHWYGLDAIITRDFEPITINRCVCGRLLVWVNNKHWCTPLF